MSQAAAKLDQLVVAVLSSSKYKFVCEDVVRSVGERELSNRRNLKEAIKSTKNKLPQIGVAYFETTINYKQALDELIWVQASFSEERFRESCMKWMCLHSSTRERLTVLDDFYKKIFSEPHPIRSVLDIACGLNLRQPTSHMIYIPT